MKIVISTQNFKLFSLMAPLVGLTLEGWVHIQALDWWWYICGGITFGVFNYAVGREGEKEKNRQEKACQPTTAGLPPSPCLELGVHRGVN